MNALGEPMEEHGDAKSRPARSGLLRPVGRLRDAC
jgi:hypothetical protein